MSKNGINYPPKYDSNPKIRLSKNLISPPGSGKKPPLSSKN